MRTTRPIMLAAAAAAGIAAPLAAGAAVNFGNLIVYNAPLTLIPFNVPAGGPYTKFVYTTDWSHQSGTAVSAQAAWNIGNPVNAIVASFSSISGTANNGNPTTITITGTLSTPVTFANSLQLIASQNPQVGGLYNVGAFWSNTSINFLVQKPFIIPDGVAYMGDILPPSGHNLVIDTGGSTFPTDVAVYSTDGYLLAARAPNTGLPGGDQLPLTLAEGDYYLFVSGAGAAFGAEDLEVVVPPDAPGGVLAGGIAGTPWPDPNVPAGEGKWFAITVVPPQCVGDVNGDGSTNAADFTILAGGFGRSVFPWSDGDLNGDGFVNAADFVILAGDFGCTAP